MKGTPSALVRDGEINGDEMHAKAIGKSDLMAAIRTSGGTSIDEVELATMWSAAETLASSGGTVGIYQCPTRMRHSFCERSLRRLPKLLRVCLHLEIAFGVGK